MHGNFVADVSDRLVSFARRRSWRIKWRYASPIILVHLIAALAFSPWFFSWAGLGAAAVGWYVFGTLGINIGYHRLLTHRSLSCPRWLERGLAILGVCCAEESPTVWVAWHRQHHAAADREQDPHSPLASFLWAHFGWLLLKSDNTEPGPLIPRYAKDLMSDRFYAWLEVSNRWFKIAMLSWLVFFIAGFAGALAAGGTPMDGLQLGASLLVWGAALRTVLLWHVTWSVNSITHLWGYRNYDTRDNSRNNFVVGLLAHGEGWHNNHHADPRSARHGHSWHEPDLTWLTIRALMVLGLAHDVVLPSPRIRAAFERRACAGGREPAPQG